jgi:outer membrane protein assembly factor BamB
VALFAGEARAGDWSFYRHDVAGTANPGEALTAAHASRFQTKWVFNRPIIANPVVSNGIVFLTGGDGNFYAVNEASGVQLWSHSAIAHGPFHCFPTSTSASIKGPVGAQAVVGNTSFAPGGDGVVYAFDTKTGTVLWQTKIADVPNLGEFLWSSAFPVGSRIYVGVASLHDCLLVPGRVVALDQSTGKVVGTWWAAANHGSGGGVWTQQAYDARTNRLFLTTGTIAQGLTPPQQPTADAFVAIDPISMQTLDSFTPFDATSGSYYADVDFGASPTLYDTVAGVHMIVATNKNGYVYALNRDNLAAGLVWSYQIAGDYGDPDLGESTIVSPTFANNTLFVAGTKTPDGHTGNVAALDPATGLAKWIFHLPNNDFVLGALASVGDVLLVPGTQALNGGVGQGSLYVLDQKSGALLATLPASGSLFSEPTYANGVLYFGDLAGHTYAMVPVGAGGADGGQGGVPDAGSGGGGGGPGTFFDAFNRTTGMGPNWVVSHGAFSTNGVAALGTAASSYAFWQGTPDPGVPVAVTLLSPLKSTYAGVTVRGTPAAPDGNHYAAYRAPDGTVNVARRNNYTYTYLATGPKLSPGSHVIALTASGGGPVTLTATVDGVQVISVVDSSASALTTTGQAGIFDYDGASQPLTDFTVGSPGTADAGTPPPDAGKPAPDAGSAPDGGAIFTDNFARTTGLGAQWRVAYGAFSTNDVAALGTAPQSYAFWEGSPGPDATAGISVTIPLSQKDNVGVTVRGTPAEPDATHYAGFAENDGTLGIARRTSYVYSILALGPKLSPGLHALALTAQGTNPVKLSLSVDGTVTLTAEDSSSSALDGGLVGMFDYYGTSVPLQNFVVYP